MANEEKSIKQGKTEIKPAETTVKQGKTAPEPGASTIKSDRNN